MNEKIYVGAAIGFSAATGVLVGWKLAERRLEQQFAELAAKEIQDAKEFYSALYKKEEYSTPESAAEAMGLSPEATQELVEAAIALQEYQGKNITMEVETEEAAFQEVAQNVFTDAEVDDADVFEQDIDYSKPHIVSADVFFNNDVNFGQVTVTYFEQDDVVADERDEAIEDVEGTIGSENLKRFGGISKDPNVVYVRNHQMKTDFEVLRSRGSFAQEVHGFIAHSDSRNRIRKFRGDDE